MKNEKTHTQLSLGVEEERLEVGPGRPRNPLPQGAMEPSEADLKKIQELVILRRSLPSGSSHRKQRLLIGSQICRLRNPGFKPDPSLSRISKQNWLKRNRAKRKEVALAWYYRNRGPLKQRVLVNTPTAIRFRNYRLNNIQFRIADRLRVILRRALKRNWVKKSHRTMELVGCSVEEVRIHIEKQFADGMNWKNAHIDHFVPVSAFDLTDPEEIECAFNWRNLRPMFGRDNMRKSSSIPSPLPSWLPAHIAARILART